MLPAREGQQTGPAGQQVGAIQLLLTHAAHLGGVMPLLKVKKMKRDMSQ